MGTRFDFKLIQAEWILGLIHSNELPDIAGEALSNGIESKSLVTLAGLTKIEMGESQKLFEQALNELDSNGMEKREALKRYAENISISILASETTPLEGAERIWRATLNAGVKEFHDLDAFIYAASELESRPEDKALFEKAIIQEANRWKGVE